MRQFGVFVTKDKFQNAGIGIQLNYGKTKDSMGFILPNKLLEEMELDTSIAGFFLYFLAFNKNFGKKPNYATLLFHTVIFEFTLKKITI